MQVWPRTELVKAKYLDDPTCPMCHKPATLMQSNSVKNPGKYYFKCCECDTFLCWAETDRRRSSRLSSSSSSSSSSSGSAAAEAKQDLGWLDGHVDQQTAAQALSDRTTAAAPSGSEQLPLAAPLSEDIRASPVTAKRHKPLPQIVHEVKEAVGVETKHMGQALCEVMEALGLPDNGTAKEKAFRAAEELDIPIHAQDQD